MKPYQFRNGDTHGDRAPAGPSPLPPSPRRATLAERARAAARLAEQDPTWGQRSAESRRFLVDLSVREAKRNKETR